MAIFCLIFLKQRDVVFRCCRLRTSVSARVVGCIVARGPVPREREETPPDTVARGPVPRDCPVDRHMARDRPSPYGEERLFCCQETVPIP